MGNGQMPMPQSQETLLHLMFGTKANATGTQSTDQKQPIQPSSVSQAIEANTSASDVKPNECFSTQPPVWQMKAVLIYEGLLELRNLTLEIPAATIIGLAGLDGSGQHLLLRFLAGYLRPVEGRFFLYGTDISHVSVQSFRELGIHYLPADRLSEGLIGAFSLTDHIILIDSQSEQGHQINLMPLLIDRKAARQKASAAIANYSIKATPDTPIAALSGGNQQRAMLSLLPSFCKGLLLDHPTRGLDLVSAHEVWQRLLGRRKDGTAIVFASSDLDELMMYSDYVLVFYSGNVSSPIQRAELSTARLAELIGGVGFQAM